MEYDTTLTLFDSDSNNLTVIRIEIDCDGVPNLTFNLPHGVHVAEGDWTGPTTTTSATTSTNMTHEEAARCLTKGFYLDGEDHLQFAFMEDVTMAQILGDLGEETKLIQYIRDNNIQIQDIR